MADLVADENDVEEVILLFSQTVETNVCVSPLIQIFVVAIILEEGTIIHKIL